MTSKIKTALKMKKPQNEDNLNMKTTSYKTTSIMRMTLNMKKILNMKTNQTKSTKPKIPNQNYVSKRTYHTRLTKPNLAYQT